MQKLFSKSVFGLMTVLLILMAALPVQADDKVIDEKRGVPIVVYGGNLSDAQINETKKLLEVPDDQKVEEHSATGEDLAKYIGATLLRICILPLKLSGKKRDTGSILTL
ncbi:hypothetical protein JNUCC1_01302 [Lentibacillus sp. JNUCC-1]|nr:hypothetical protein [Lentibacillus sp. JNUCC-1]